eukprot:CAMPEP_0179139422 /NCGR_PEP_ID=MMETSP0796-20121207/66687_1 /TAXON_ID=73915 /ORGANISM="Pyrodinium bahamense, Strain pbaha01" /LENGTH=225 /DNA_ID=CAMNT_0020838863 /DNA_START=44 /DNA_END=721 /DNA_ORIENTATION=+
MSTAPLRRSFQELVTNVELLGGKAVELLPYPPPAKGVRSASRILAQVAVVPYGVLGTQMTKARSTRKSAPEPDACTVSGIYSFLGISRDPSFPSDVREAIQEPLQAKFHAYGRKLVIHVVGPNFQGRHDCTHEEAVDELSQAYASTLSEFAASGVRKLRLLPISSSIFAGRFVKDMPDLTAQALQGGFEMLSAAEQDKVLGADRLEMCIFNEAELEAFEEAFREG